MTRYPLLALILLLSACAKEPTNPNTGSGSSGRSGSIASPQHLGAPESARFGQDRRPISEPAPDTVDSSLIAGEPLVDVGPQTLPPLTRSKFLSGPQIQELSTINTAARSLELLGPKVTITASDVQSAQPQTTQGSFLATLRKYAPNAVLIPWTGSVKTQGHLVPKKITVHMTQGPLFTSQTKAHEAWKEAQRTDIRKFNSMSYHFGIDGAGRIYQGTPLDREGAHTGGQNAGNIGIALMGDYRTPAELRADMRAGEPRPTYAMLPPSAKQLETLTALIAAVSDYGGADGIFNVQGHNDRKPGYTTCPGGKLKTHFARVRTLALQLRQRAK